jgi:prepilin-type N-terminal cleavage/methylation domain-containing protein
MSKKSIFKSSKFTKGFTLIELLVVIAIIGILSAVVVVSINSARDKSKAAFIKSSLKSLYSQAEIFYTQNGTYAGLFDAITL